MEESQVPRQGPFWTNCQPADTRERPASVSRATYLTADHWCMSEPSLSQGHDP